MKQTDDLRIKAIIELSSPAQVHEELPISDSAADTVYAARQAVHRILHDEDDRLLVIIGPCSAHDPEAALEYAKRLQPVREALKDELEIIMRVYFEKPRTTVGWKGLINDPDIDDSFEINKGLRLARKLLLDINNLGVPAGTEYLDLISPQYIADLISWGAIGARTTESQAHRELASGLSCPVGFKNATNGSMRVALDAIRSSSRPHHFLSVTKEGRSAIFSTSGNDDCHVILRGGSRPNYDSESINIAADEMEATGQQPRMMVDFSHANSRKQHKRQLLVGLDVASQISRGDTRIMGAMIESFLVAGRQDREEAKPLTYGQSITDACISWDDSTPLLEALASAVRARRKEH
ncbi:MAG: phospho-2-dehydro-3-deoxyheptonate aldolase [Gammaproteobacteria bacterium (ex Lamellibrachia satsuma)]|nr:MAG: 3-deoxy-7-phosphoheptulonate synthase AroG [Gammaproteobacteria bacterium (ex Lamellibrachia satsuma)]RRS33281.1 MAG: phospho-2-dehydro-3-deoxyheptonate aldolase [Gammaproteobacteria bacterium (ex Lamellibrachia satsuma)]RRS33861.1 MAG: phospho-2-dehydro-3-deoxyheptonate aldolase [Gammaproteobacteria bacterium (ex Lamellibrachia satsuma)]